MKTIILSEKVYDKLKVVEGKEIDEKIFYLLETNALMRLKECEEHIFRFEVKYRMDYKGFKTAWKKGAIKRKHSHQAERDFMEWEGFVSERKKWLSVLSDFKD